MPVYFITAGDASAPEAVKIGWVDNDVQRRLRGLQAGAWHTLTIARVIDGTRQTERWLHRHFREHHIAREWFRFTPEMLTIEPPALVAVNQRPAKPRALVLNGTPETRAVAFDAFMAWTQEVSAEEWQDKFGGVTPQERVDFILSFAPDEAAA